MTRNMPLACRAARSNEPSTRVGLPSTRNPGTLSGPMEDSMENSAQLDALSRGFRSKYLGHEEITAQLRAWAEAFPRIVRLRSIGKSAEGRDLWLLT
ncbi:MAG: M14 family zinc carboxypeptidase, partial [Polyangiales bacterium]